MKVLRKPALGAESEDGQRWRTRPAEGGSLPYPAGAAILSDRLHSVTMPAGRTVVSLSIRALKGSISIIHHER